MPKRVILIDHDGCLMHIGCIESKDKCRVTMTNQELIHVLRNEAPMYSKMIVSCGSARQSFSADLINRFSGRYDRGSCFPALIEFTKALGNGAELERFLLADVYGDLEHGVSFKKATDPAHNICNSEHAHWPGDETKLSIIYAHMHHITTKNPCELITFDFIDDRWDILEALGRFFGKHPELIPNNVTLRLFCYAGGELVCGKTAFKGTGFIDANYRQTVKDMSDSVNRKMKASAAAASSQRIDIAPNLEVEALVNRQPFRCDRTWVDSTNFQYLSAANPNRLFRRNSESAIPQLIAQNSHRLYRSNSESDIGENGDFKSLALALRKT